MAAGDSMLSRTTHSPLISDNRDDFVEEVEDFGGAAFAALFEIGCAAATGEDTFGEAAKAWDAKNAEQQITSDAVNRASLTDRNCQGNRIGGAILRTMPLFYRMAVYAAIFLGGFSSDKTVSKNAGMPNQYLCCQ